MSTLSLFDHGGGTSGDDEPAANSPADVGWSDADRRREPLRFFIPAGTPAKACRSCNARIYWITPKNMPMPANPDGTSHFATCPQAAQHRRPR